MSEDEESLDAEVFESLPNTLPMHLKTSEIDLDTYRKINRIQLSRSVLAKTRVYLDTNIWVDLRKTQSGEQNNSSYKNLLNTLKTKCESDQVICPLSYSSVSELLNQEHLETRAETARLMDRLGKAVCIDPPDKLLWLEAGRWLDSTLPITQSDAQVIDLVWTKVPFFVGQPIADIEGLSDAQCVAFTKACDDASASLTVEQFANQLGKREGLPELRKSTADLKESLNREKIKAENLKGSFESYFKSEVWGGLDAQIDVLSAIMEALCSRAGYEGISLDEARNRGGDMLRRLIGSAYQHGKIKKEIPQIHINASLHALLRLDTRRKYKPNDFEDFRHAGAALPYCNVFITESPLATLLKSKSASLADTYDCLVFSDIDAAAKYLDETLND